MAVRDATPDDGAAVSHVHVSNVDQRMVRDDEALGPPRPFAELAPYERYLLGGPWMDPAACAQHLEKVLASGQWALVVEDDRGRIVGEAEVIVGPDPRWGRTAHLDVMAVKRDVQRRGYGSALIAEARRRAVAAGCETLSTNPEPAAVGFYRRNGLERILARQRALSVPTELAHQRPRWDARAAPIAEFGALASLDLLFGRFQTSYATWIKSTWVIPGLTDQLAGEEGTFARPSTFYRIAQYPRRTRSANAWLWTEPGTDPTEALLGLLGRTRELGFDTVETTIDANLDAELRVTGIVRGEESILVGTALQPP